MTDSDEPLCDRARRLLDREAEAGAGDDLADDDADRTDEIVLLLRRAVALGEWSAPGLLASTYLDRGDRLLAVEVLSPAVHTDGRDDLAGLLGETLSELGHQEGAEAAFLRGLDAADAAATNSYGVFLWGRGRTQEAAYVLDRSARGGDQLAPLNLVTLHLDELDDPVSAAIVAEEFHDETRPSTVVALADVRLAAGRVDEAETHYRRAVELGAACSHIYYGWFLQDRRNDLDGAEEQLRLAREAGELRAGYHLARFLHDAGRLDEAQPLLEESFAAGDTEAGGLLEAEYHGVFDVYDD